MTTYYKLTDEKGYTHGGTAWGPGKVLTAPGKEKLCTAGWLHAYSDPLLAMFMNPVHAAFLSPRMFQFESSEVPKTDGTKLGFTRIEFGKWMDAPSITLEQRVRFAILAAKTVYTETDWVTWADGWLSGRDRTEEGARAVAARVAGELGEAAASAWEATAGAMAQVRAWGVAKVWAETRTAEAAKVWAETRTAEAAEWAARAWAAWAARAINLVAIARLAMEG